MTAESVVLGAPGVYVLPAVPRVRPAVPRMDVAVFVGVAERGPANVPVEQPVPAGRQDRAVPLRRSVPVAVESWDEYVETFGGFDVPALLPRAVAAYFGEGGERAYIIRVVAPPTDDERDETVPGCARFTVRGLPELRAADEGSWGNGLRVLLRYTTRFLRAAVSAPPHPPGLVLADGAAVPVGSLLRVVVPGRAAALRVVAELRRVGRTAAVEQDVVAVLDRALPGPPDPPDPQALQDPRAALAADGGADRSDDALVVELVEAELTVEDTRPGPVRRERLIGLGTQPSHPRFLPDVLRRESRLLAPVEQRPAGWVPTDLAPVEAREATVPGRDRFALVTVADLLGEQVDDDPQSEGVWALADLPDVGSVVVPDLFADAGTVLADESGRMPPGQSTFLHCAGTPVAPAAPSTPAPRLGQLALDLDSAVDLEKLVRRQYQLVERAVELGVVALLDVPPRLPVNGVQRWRSSFDSSYAAAYHPWLRVVGPGPGGRLLVVPPSAVAAGIIARRELRDGVARGPANERTTTVVDVTSDLDDAAHGILHELGIDVFRSRRDGVWLTGARTLSPEQGLRQLAVRRLMLLVERFVRNELAWAAFEPADDALRAGLRRHLDHLLGGFFDAGALAGRTPDEAWFVEVGTLDEEVRGGLVVEVGIAPAEPLEFVLLRLELDADGTISDLFAGGAAGPDRRGVRSG